MLAETDRQIVREFQRCLADVVPVLDLRVFGSRARGDAAPDSDLDVFIELEACTPELRQRISEIAWEVGFEMDRVISKDTNEKEWFLDRLDRVGGRFNFNLEFV
jgi:predicted nucleotidyltransferase